MSDVLQVLWSRLFKKILPLLLIVQCFPIISYCGLSSQSIFDIAEQVAASSAWEYFPNDLNIGLPTKIGVPLNIAIDPAIPCCSGKYRVTFKLPLGTRLEQHERFGVLLPPIGGLKNISINETSYQLPHMNYSSVGPLVDLRGNDFIDGVLTLWLEIDSPRNHYAGPWTIFSPKIDSVPKLTLMRDQVVLHERVIPFFTGIIFLIFSIMSIWISWKTGSRLDILPTYLFCWLATSLFFVCMSGLVRWLFPVMGPWTHFPCASVAFFSIFLVLSSIANVPKQKVHTFKILSFLLIAIEIFAGDETRLTESIQILAMTGFAIFTIYPIAVLKRKEKTSIEKLIYFLSIIYVLGFLSSLANTFFHIFGQPHPTVQIIRYTTFPLLLAFVIDFTYRFSERTVAEIKVKAARMINLQLAHDIRSPLAALNTLILDKDLIIPEDNRTILTFSVDRLNRIATDLLKTHQKNNKKNCDKKEKAPCESFEDLTQCSDIVKLIKTIINEKLIQIENAKKIKFSVNEAMIKADHAISLNTSQFERMLSNILANSIEAISYIGEISIALNEFADVVYLRIDDTGSGMPKSVLSKLGGSVFSYGKRNGNGLGIYYTAGVVKRAGGSLTIQSQLGKGTRVDIYLPKVSMVKSS